MFLLLLFVTPTSSFYVSVIIVLLIAYPSTSFHGALSIPFTFIPFSLRLSFSSSHCLFCPSFHHSFTSFHSILLLHLHSIPPPLHSIPSSHPLSRHPLSISSHYFTFHQHCLLRFPLHLPSFLLLLRTSKHFVRRFSD